MHIANLYRCSDIRWIVFVHVQQHHFAVLHHLWQWFCQRGTWKGCHPNGWLSSQPADLRYVLFNSLSSTWSIDDFQDYATNLHLAWYLHPYRVSWVSAGKHSHPQALSLSGSPYSRAAPGMNRLWHSISLASKTRPGGRQRNPEGFSPWVRRQCHYREFPELIVYPWQAQPTLLSTRVRSTIKMSNLSRTPFRIGLSPSRA